MRKVIIAAMIGCFATSAMAAETPEQRMKRKMMGAMLVYGDEAKPVVEQCLRENKIARGKVNNHGAAQCMDRWIKTKGYKPVGQWGK